MSYEIESLKRIRYSIEPAGSYAQDRTNDLPTNFKDIKVSEASMEVNKEMIENATMMQRLDKYLAKIPSRKRCSLSLTSYLNGSGTAVTGSNSYAFGDNPNVDILEAIMGAKATTYGGGLVAAGSGFTAGRFQMDVASFIAGTVFGIVNTTNNQMECFRVDRASTNFFHVTASVGASGWTPASGSVVYGGVTCYLRQDPDTSLQFLVEGADADNKFTLMGLQGGFGLSTPIGELATINYSLENGANWVTGSLTAGALEQACYDDAVPPPFVDGLVYVGTRLSGSSLVGSMVKIDTNSIELTPNISYIDVTSEKGVNNIVRKRRNRSVPVLSGKFVIYFNDSGAELNAGGPFEWFATQDNIALYAAECTGAAICLGLQIGTQPGNTTFMFVPKMQVTNVQRVDAGGLAGLEISFDAMEDDLSDPAVTGNPTLDASLADLAKSAFTISFL